ncbi:MAG: hypothetical protein ACR2RB_00560 [Gammaproteobacteria bacterium]
MTSKIEWYDVAGCDVSTSKSDGENCDVVILLANLDGHKTCGIKMPHEQAELFICSLIDAVESGRAGAMPPRLAPPTLN